MKAEFKKMDLKNQITLQLLLTSLEVYISKSQKSCKGDAALSLRISVMT